MRRVSMGQWRRGWRGEIGHALSLLAVVCQLVAILLQPVAADARGAALPAVICHAGGDGAPLHDQAPAHRPDCALCPLCLAVALHAVGAAPPVLPAPRLVSQAATSTPIRASPAPGVFLLSARARAPPASV